MLPPPKLATERGCYTVMGISFVLSIVAGIIVYYIGKWLDKNSR